MKWIVADSGGTSTNWAYGEETELGRFDTASLHPRNQSVFPEEDKQKLAEVITSFSPDYLYFYGAGMSNPDNQLKTDELLRSLGFSSFSIETDALAAGLALCGEHHGYVAILGTGSILLEMNEGKIQQRVGGLGPAIGDEGSGFYFGKLFVQNLQESGEWNNELDQLFGSREEFFKNTSPGKYIAFCSSLPEKTKNCPVKAIHSKNIQTFVDEHLLQLMTGEKVLHVVGSYGYHQKEVLAEVLQLNGWQLGRCLASPMDDLVAYVRKK